MAQNLVLTVAALLLFFSFAHTHASRLDLPENDVVTPHEMTDLREPVSKPKNSIRLPSDRPEFESLPVAEIEPETKPVNLPQTAESTEARLESETQTVPLTFVSFRPINHHFPRRASFPFFRHGHRCRHHHRFPKPWGPRVEIPYGEDMILSGKGDRGFDPVSRGGGRQIPGSWANFRHDRPRFSDMQDIGDRGEMKWRRPHHHEHHRFDEERMQEHEGGLLKKIRRFLDHF